MDIFTSQLTRLIPVPIKPVSLKVKALLKKSGSAKLNDEADQLEEHGDYYMDDEDTKARDMDQEKSSLEVSPQRTLLSVEDKSFSQKKARLSANVLKEQCHESPKVKHLDVYA